MSCLSRAAAELLAVRLKARWVKEVFFSVGVGVAGIGGGVGR